MRKLLVRVGALVALAMVASVSSVSAAMIPADALIDFQVDAWAPVGNGPYTTHVVAWSDTGLFLNEGDTFALTATGIAAPSSADMGNGGQTPDGRTEGVLTGPESLAPYLPPYALVGKIGTDLGDEFLIGSSFLGVANDTGILYLGFNDTYYWDNLGFWTVNSTVVPEPSTAILLSMGLAGLHVVGRRRRR